MREVRRAARAAIAAGVLLSVVVLVAGCGSSSHSGPASGSYGGTTSQGEPLTLAVASDGKSLTQLRVQARYTCPGNATAADGAPRGPSGNVPLSGDSFSGTFSVRGTSYQLVGTYKAGAFSGTLSASFPALTGSGSCTSGTVSWRATHGGHASAAASSTAATSTTTTTSSPGVARQQLASAAAAYNSGAATFNARSRADAGTGNLKAFKDDLAQFRAVLAQFDSAVGGIQFPAAQRSAVTALGGADQTEINDLDGAARTTTAQAAITLYNRATADNQKVISAEQALYNAL